MGSATIVHPSGSFCVQSRRSGEWLPDFPETMLPDSYRGRTLEAEDHQQQQSHGPPCTGGGLLAGQEHMSGCVQLVWRSRVDLGADGTHGTQVRVLQDGSECVLKGRTMAPGTSGTPAFCTPQSTPQGLWREGWGSIRGPHCLASLPGPRRMQKWGCMLWKRLTRKEKTTARTVSGWLAKGPRPPGCCPSRLCAPRAAAAERQPQRQRPVHCPDVARVLVGIGM